MPYDPNIPADHAPLSSAVMRANLSALNQDWINGVNSAIASSSNNSNAVATLSEGASGSYDPSQMQRVLDKIDELINALRR